MMQEQVLLHISRGGSCPDRPEKLGTKVSSGLTPNNVIAIRAKCGFATT